MKPSVIAADQFGPVRLGWIGPGCQIIRLYTVSDYIRSVRIARHYAHKSSVAETSGRYELTTACLCVADDDALSLYPRLDAARRCAM